MELLANVTVHFHWDVCLFATLTVAATAWVLFRAYVLSYFK